MNKINLIITACILLICITYNQPAQPVVSGSDWKSKSDNELLLPGHRNWILVADKALVLGAVSVAFKERAVSCDR